MTTARSVEANPSRPPVASTVRSAMGSLIVAAVAAVAAGSAAMVGRWVSWAIALRTTASRPDQGLSPAQLEWLGWPPEAAYFPLPGIEAERLSITIDLAIGAAALLSLLAVYGLYWASGFRRRGRNL